MAETSALPRRNLEGIVDAHGHLMHWKCTACSMTLPIREEDTGLEFSQETTALFNEHDCNDHRQTLSA